MNKSQEILSRANKVLKILDINEAKKLKFDHISDEDDNGYKSIVLVDSQGLENYPIQFSDKLVSKAILNKIIKLFN